MKKLFITAALSALLVLAITASSFAGNQANPKVGANASSQCLAAFDNQNWYTKFSKVSKIFSVDSMDVCMALKRPHSSADIDYTPSCLYLMSDPGIRQDFRNAAQALQLKSPGGLCLKFLVAKLKLYGAKY